VYTVPGGFVLVFAVSTGNPIVIGPHNPFKLPGLLIPPTGVLPLKNL
jgi:hypothetical protein